MTKQPRAPTAAEPAQPSPSPRPSGADRPPFTAEDRALLASYDPLVQALAELFGAHCEVVLHSLEDPRRSVVRIANGHVTGRAPGSPVTDLALDMLRDFRAGGGLHKTYFSTARSGHQLKSATTLIRNGAGRVVGMLCVNLDLDVPLHRFAAAYSPAPEPGMGHLSEHFASNVSDLLETTVDEAVRAAESDPAVPASRRNKEIVSALFDRGVFEIKEAIHHVAARLKITHHTVYMHIRRRRQECGDKCSDPLPTQGARHGENDHLD
ncbi:MAG: PAS domain-containing protein [Thermodesulfobacteriota bacterium]